MLVKPPSNNDCRSATEKSLKTRFRRNAHGEKRDSGFRRVRRG
jgi:hypothetical protein